VGPFVGFVLVGFGLSERWVKRLFGDSISSTDALVFIRGSIVTAVATGLALLINRLFQIPAG
jgi:hypothetical protein